MHEGKSTKPLEALKQLLQDDQTVLEAALKAAVSVDSEQVSNIATIKWLLSKGAPVTKDVMRAINDHKIQSILEGQTDGAASGHAHVSGDRRSGTSANGVKVATTVLAPQCPSSSNGSGLVALPKLPQAAQPSSKTKPHGAESVESKLLPDNLIPNRDLYRTYAEKEHARLNFEEQFVYYGLEELLAAGEKHISQADLKAKMLDDPPESYAIWRLRAIIELKAEVRQDAVLSALRQALQKYADPAQVRHRDDVEAFNATKSHEQHDRIELCDPVVHAIDAINVGSSTKGGTRFDCGCLLQGGEVQDGLKFGSIGTPVIRSALHERFSDKTDQESQLVLAVRMLLVAAVAVARAYYPGHNENDVRDAALDMIGIARLESLLPSQLCNGFEVRLLKELPPARPGPEAKRLRRAPGRPKGSINENKRADICVILRTQP